jgi:hypothetical protein
MTGGRWGGILNIWWNNRCLEIVKDPKLVEYNVMDVDYLKYLWNKQFPELPIN